MKVLEHFSIPYQGLKNGMHTFRFIVDEGFFESFETSFVTKGSFDVALEFDKRPDMSIAVFHCEGKVTVPCDRCLVEFELPVITDFTLHIKYGENDPNEDEVIFIDTETSKINFAQYIYEWICISLPMVRMHEDISDCDPEVIRKLSGDQEETKDSVWSSLNKLNFDN